MTPHLPFLVRKKPERLAWLLAGATPINTLGHNYAISQSSPIKPIWSVSPLRHTELVPAQELHVEQLVMDYSHSKAAPVVNNKYRPTTQKLLLCRSLYESAAP